MAEAVFRAAKFDADYAALVAFAGELVVSLAGRIFWQFYKIIDMLEQAAAKIKSHGLIDRIDLVKSELESGLALSSCDMVIMNWTLRFVRPVAREALVRAIVQVLKPGDENYALLRHCGFASADSFFRGYNFEFLVAVKAGITPT